MRQAGNAQIREALSALCRVLSGGGGGSPGPEAFRRAKFNRPEPTAEFWKLLYCLLKQIYQGKDGSPTATNEKETVENQITFVKSVLWNQGYGRSAFYHLPHDGTEGSREALLAFSWLLNRIKLLEKILEINRVKVGDEITACTCPQELFLSRNGNEDAAASSSVKREVDVRYIQWLSGKLRFCWRTLHATQQEKCALLYKIHSYTQGCHVDQHLNHLSVMETDLVRKPENYSEVTSKQTDMSYNRHVNSTNCNVHHFKESSPRTR
ncbi:hypothetical protein FKM82_016445 [Ascaphus truei]